jgi:hypothetical protein
MCIIALKKLCNCPSLLYQLAKEADKSQEDSIYRGLLSLFPPNYNDGQCYSRLAV